MLGTLHVPGKFGDHDSSVLENTANTKHVRMSPTHQSKVLSVPQMPKALRQFALSVPYTYKTVTEGNILVEWLPLNNNALLTVMTEWTQDQALSNMLNGDQGFFFTPKGSAPQPFFTPRTGLT